jgi:16S rRNA (guanine966-N2)-methyltransferase
MRVITGSARGTKLYTPEWVGTRPTSERNKEALFSMIQFEIEDKCVLDLFAGCGQLGIEALSRGAAQAMFIDSSADAIALCKKNTQKAHLFEKSRFLISDYRNYLRKARGRDRYDIVLLDPPYDFDITEVLDRLLSSELVYPGSLIICETDGAIDFSSKPELLEKLEVVRSNTHGRTALTIVTPKENFASEE